VATLIFRATPAQAKVYRMVRGAVVDAVRAHKGWSIDDERLPRSIAKRAAGTLTAGWPEVLALRAGAVSDDGPATARNEPSAKGAGITPKVKKAPDSCISASSVSGSLRDPGAKGVAVVGTPSPHAALRRTLVRWLKGAQAAKQPEREAVIIDLLRELALQAEKR